MVKLSLKIAELETRAFKFGMRLLSVMATVQRYGRPHGRRGLNHCHGRTLSMHKHNGSIERVRCACASFLRDGTDTDLLLYCTDGDSSG